MTLKRQEVYDGSVRHTRDITITGEGTGIVRFLGGWYTVQQHKLYGYWQIGHRVKDAKQAAQ